MIAGSTPAERRKRLPTREEIATALMREAARAPTGLVPQYVVAAWSGVPLVIGRVERAEQADEVYVVATVARQHLPLLRVREAEGRIRIVDMPRDTDRGLIAQTARFYAAVPDDVQRALLPLLVHDHRPVRLWALATLGG